MGGRGHRRAGLRVLAKSLAVATLPLLAEGSSIVGMDFDARVAWPAYNWMGVAKASLESVTRYLARDLGPRGIRVNLCRGRSGAHHGRQVHPGLLAAWRTRGPTARRSAGT